jgi:hypothetical protein
MTTVDLSQERITELLQRQNGLCGLTGKKFEGSNEDIQIFSLFPNTNNEELDNFVIIWKNADLSLIKKNDAATPIRKYFFPYANFSDYNDEQKSKDILEELNNLIELSKDDAHLKNSIFQMRNLIKTVQSLNFQSENYKKLIDEINVNLSEAEKRFSIIRNQMNEESSKFFNKYKSKIDELMETQPKWEKLRAARQKLMLLQKEISDTKQHISRNTIEDLKKLITDALNFISQKQIAERENYEMECSDNYLKLKNKFEKLIATISETTDYSKIRQDLIDAQKMISANTLKRNHQEELYQMIRNGFDILSQNQEKEKSSFMQEANENYSKLSPLVDNAIKIATSTDTFKEARETLIAAQTSIKGMALTKEQRDELYGKIREVFEKINVLQEQERNEFLKVSEENYQKLIDKINLEKQKILDNPHFKTIRENLLTIQSEIRVWKLKTDHRNKLYNHLKDIFTILDAKRNEFFESQNKEKKSKIDNASKNLSLKMKKLEEAIQIDKDELDKLQNQISQESNQEIITDLQDKISRINLRISEKQKRIDEIKEKLEEIQ